MAKSRPQGSQEEAGGQRKAKPRSRANGEGTIFKRTRNGNTKWYAELIIGLDAEGKKKVLRHSADTRKECADQLVKWQKERSDGSLALPTRETVGEFVAKWIDETAPMQVGPSTLRLYHNVFEWYIKPCIGSLPLAKLEPRQIQGMFHKLLEDGKSPRTVQLVRVVLRRALEQAVDWNDLPRNPVDKVKTPRVERKEMKVLSLEQLADFIKAANSERLHALFILAVTAGLRQGELIALQWRDVDLQKGTVTVHRTRKVVLDDNGAEEEMFGKPKTDAAIRTIPLATVALESLRRWKKEQVDELRDLGLWRPVDDLVFTSQANTPVHPRNLRDDGFRRICQAIGLTERRQRQTKAKDGSVTRVVPLLRFHDLRHSAVTFMLSQGVKPEVVQKIAGHSDITTTLRIYRHVFEQEKKEAAQVVDDFLKAADKKAR